MSSATPARRGMALGSLVLTTVLLAGCAMDSGSASDGAMRTVDTVRGEVEVPEVIESVVVLEGRRDTDMVLALDLPLVGFPARDAADAYELRAPLADAIDEATDAGARELFLVDEINLEAIAEAAPSIIVSRSTEIDPIIDELEAIAPVVAIGNQDETTWQEDLRTVGEATGTTEKAEALIAEYDARVEEIRTTYAQQIADTTVVPFEYDDEGSDVGAQRLESIILQEIGAVPSEAFASAIDADETVEFSFEQTLSAYEDAEALYVFVTSAQWWETLSENELWTALPAVQSGQVVRGDRLTHDGGPITAMHILDAIEEMYASVS